MTLEEQLTGERVSGEPSLWPAWTYLSLAIMTVGLVVALMVLAITSSHRTEDRATAARVEAIETTVKALSGRVEVNTKKIVGGGE